MFQRNDDAIGGGAAALALNAPLPALALPGLGAGTGWRDAAERLRLRIAEADLVVDLGAQIGSRRWFRGLLTCGLLCGAAIAFAPRFGALPGAAPRAYSDSQWDEARAEAIAPLAFGGDTGRRMASTAAVEPLLDTPERPIIQLTATLGQGDGFAHVLTRAGVGRDEAEDIALLVGDLVRLADIAPGTVLDITLGRRPEKSAPRPLDYMLFRARFDLKIAVERVNGELKLRTIPIPVDNTPLRITGRVGSGLYLAARAAGAPAKAIQSYLQALATQFSIGDIAADDHFDLIVEHRHAQTGESETGDLLYAGLATPGRKVQLLKWSNDDRAQWFEASGVGERRGEMHMPVANAHETSGFGWRMHPLLGYTRMHKGIDYGAAYGSPIMAATDGVVAFAGWHGGHGNYVLLKHAGNMMTGYAHMSRILATPGSHVRGGQVIGYVGSTGLSTGPHLHFEVYRDNVAVNPATVKFDTTMHLAGAELARFRDTLAHLLNVRTGAAPTATADAARKPAQTAAAVTTRFRKG